VLGRANFGATARIDIDALGKGNELRCHFAGTGASLSDSVSAPVRIPRLLRLALTQAQPPRFLVQERRARSENREIHSQSRAPIRAV
jgi:hypothetical protein